MIYQNIFIINYNSLYEILDEIKDNLSFKITKYESENDFANTSNLNIKNCLFISKSYEKLLLNKNLNEKNFLNLNNLPLQLNKLIELINI